MREKQANPTELRMAKTQWVLAILGTIGLKWRNKATHHIGKSEKRSLKYSFLSYLVLHASTYFLEVHKT